MTRVYLPEGTIVGGTYRIKSVLGAGGFGVTYAAEDEQSTVAIKEYYPEEFSARDDVDFTIGPKRQRDAETYEWGRRSFLDEAETLVRFRHQSIVRVASVFEERGTVYMAMAFEDGPSFEKWLRQLGRPPSQAELDKIVWNLLDALEQLHAQNYIHRDIAPDNIIIRKDGTPVLLDFGAARRTIADKTSTLTGLIKPGYSPQEQYAADGRLQGPWTDLYALGATLYRAVSGTSPEEATLRVNDDTIQPSTSLPNAALYRTSFLEGIDACLQTVPKHRPQSVARAKVLLCGEPATRLTEFPTRLTAFPTRIVAATLSLRRRPRIAFSALVAALVAISAGYGAYSYSEAQRLAEIRLKERIATEEFERRRKKAEEDQRLHDQEEKRIAEERKRLEAQEVCVAFTGETVNELNMHKVTRGRIADELISPPRRAANRVSGEGVTWCVLSNGVRYVERLQKAADVTFPFESELKTTIQLPDTAPDKTVFPTEISGRADRSGSTISLASRFKTATHYRDTNTDSWIEAIINFSIEVKGDECRVIRYENSSNVFMDNRNSYRSVAANGATGQFNKSRTTSSNVRCSMVAKP